MDYIRRCCYQDISSLGSTLPRYVIFRQVKFEGWMEEAFTMCVDVSAKLLGLIFVG